MLSCSFQNISRHVKSTQCIESCLQWPSRSTGNGGHYTVKGLVNQRAPRTVITCPCFHSHNNISKDRTDVLSGRHLAGFSCTTRVMSTAKRKFFCTLVKNVSFVEILGTCVVNWSVCPYILHSLLTATNTCISITLFCHHCWFRIQTEKSKKIGKTM